MKSLTEHNCCHRKVLLNVRGSGLKLNKSKCQFREECVKFLGHIVSSEGIRADPCKIDQITTKIPVQQSLTKLQRFLGNGKLPREIHYESH